MIEIKDNDDLITRRIKDEINKKGFKNQKEFCESFNPKMQESLLSDIFKGERRTIDNIKIIADKLNSSFDYLVGFNNDNTRDVEIKDILKKTGLTYTSYTTLCDWLMNNNRFKKIINDLLSDGIVAYYLLSDFDSFLSFLPTKEKLDELRRSEAEEIYLKRFNKSLISFKYNLEETIHSMEEHLKDIDKKIKTIEDELEKYSLDQIKNKLNSKDNEMSSDEQLQKYFKLTNTRAELMIRKSEIESRLLQVKETDNGKK